LKELWIESGPDRSYGNYGIMDQIEALKWVQRNIHQFGGDPDNVVIYGESGGGTAVYCLLCSPLAAGLFQKASPASGAPNIRTTYLEANTKFRSVVNNTGCQKRETKEEVVACLQEFDANKLLGMIGQYKKVLTYHWKFPVNKPYTGYPIEILDPVVVITSPDKLLQKSTDNRVELLIGNCAQEAGPFPHTPAPDANLTSWRALEDFLSPKMDTFKPKLYPEVLPLYKADEHYPPHNITPKYVYEEMTSDVLVICTTNNVADYLSRVANYTVSRFVMSQPPSKEIGLGIETAYHTWDSIILFGLKFFKPGISQLPESDRNLMKQFRGMYKDFMYSMYMDQYRDMTTDFWWGASFVKPGMLSYHQKQCAIWKEFGLLKHSWGNLGK